MVSKVPAGAMIRFKLARERSLTGDNPKCGGFISPKWLGQPAPELYSETARLTPSQRKVSATTPAAECRKT